MDWLSFLGYFLGIFVALATYLLTQAVAHVREGLRFRRLLALDLRLIVTAHWDHLPEIGRLTRLAEEAIAAREQGDEPETPLPPIWDCDYSALPLLYQNAQHLSAESFQECLNFYDSLGRLEETRQSYNSSVLSATADPSSSLGQLRIAKSCLAFMNRYYRDVVRRGARLLLDLSGRHRLVRADRGYLLDLLHRVSE